MAAHSVPVKVLRTTERVGIKKLKEILLQGDSDGAGWTIKEYTSLCVFHGNKDQVIAILGVKEGIIWIRIINPWVIKGTDMNIIKEISSLLEENGINTQLERIVLSVNYGPGENPYEVIHREIN